MGSGRARPKAERDRRSEAEPIPLRPFGLSVELVLVKSLLEVRGVAQSGRALRSGRRGPRFESGRPDW